MSRRNRPHTRPELGLGTPSEPLGMLADQFTRPNSKIGAVLYFDVPRSAAHGYLIVLVLAYIVVAVHTPITLYPGAPHDDGLYMSLGQHLAEGRWLGPFNQFTLMKGPGYPAFLAVTNWLGLSVSLAHALFHCFAVTFFTVACHRFVKSNLLSGLMFALLLWQPVLLTVFLLRVLREEIYNPQTLIIFALLLATLFSARENLQRLFYGALSGVALGWFWLTREEGLWILPLLFLLSLAAAFQARRDRHLFRIVAPLSIIIAVFSCTQIGFRTGNWWYYGKFVGVDLKEANFQKALGAIHSVRSGGIKPFISITRAARQHVYNVSPAFASLKPYFDPPGEAPPSVDSGGWVGFTCGAVPDACGEIAAGWFLWALRDAASHQGHYASPAQASAFFGQIADEISTACTRGDLQCQPQLLDELPPVIWSDVVKRLPSRYARAFDMMILTQPPLQFNASSGSEYLLAASLRFLNHPLYSPPANAQDLATYTMNGWYYRSANEWFSIKVRAPNETLTDARAERRASPDLQTILNDPAAANQRFTIHTRCNDQCVLTFETEAGLRLEKTLAELQKGVVGFKLGDANLIIESTMKHPHPLYAKTWGDVLSERVRVAIVTNYHLVFLPVLTLGAIMFLATSLLYWREAAYNVCYILALASWMLVAIRITVLVLIDATSFPALQVSYLTPAYFMAVAGAVLSCAAWFQLSAPMQPSLCRTVEETSAKVAGLGWEARPKVIN